MKLSDLFTESTESEGLSLAELAKKAVEGLRPPSIQKIIDDETSLFNKSTKITRRNTIPETTQIPIENPLYWLQIPDVIACFVDMEGSTKLSASTHERSTAKVYRYFTNTAIRIFHHFDARYIDVKGDGVFALFDSDQLYTSLAATISIKTFVSKEFTPKTRSKTELEIGGHFGIDQRTVLVRKLGLKFSGNRTDRQNEVWAGKPVNMAAKLAGISTNNRLWVSDRYYSKLKDDKATMSCGCPGGQSMPLWQEEDLTDDTRFDFDKAWSLGSNWCDIHGKSFCRDLVRLDK